MPVRQLQQQVTSREFAEYSALMRIEPWGGHRLDYLAALIVQHVAALVGARRPRLVDFLPAWWGGERTRRKTASEMAAVFDQFAHAHNAAIKARDHAR